VFHILVIILILVFQLMIQTYSKL